MNYLKTIGSSFFMFKTNNLSIIEVNKSCKNLVFIEEQLSINYNMEDKQILKTRKSRRKLMYGGSKYYG